MAKVNPAAAVKTAAKKAATAATPEAKLHAQVEADTKAAKADIKAKAKEKTETALVTVKAAALSIDVGPRVVAGLAKAMSDEAAALSALDGVKAKRYDLLADTTLAIVKAAKADDEIDLATSFGDKKAMTRLNSQIDVALGLRVTSTVGKGDKAKTILALNPSVAKYFPAKTDNATQTKAKQSFRTNLRTLMKKCMQAAHAIVQQNIDASIDKTAGTLKLAGPAVAKEFGAPSILLNEKQTFNDGTSEKTLSQKPSFTAVAAMSAPTEQAKTKIGRRGVASGGTGLTAVDPMLAIVSICDTLVKGITRLGNAPTLTDNARKALTSAQSAIKTALSVSA